MNNTITGAPENGGKVNGTFKTVMFSTNETICRLQIKGGSSAYCQLNYTR
jgi:hypothetical protein